MKLLKPDQNAYAKFMAYKNIMTKENCANISDAELNETLAFLNSYDWTDTMYTENGKVGVKDAIGQVIIPAEYDSCPNLYNMNSRPSAMALVKDDRYYVVKTDGSGSLSIPQDFEFAAITSSFNLIARNEDGKYGLMTTSGEILIPFEMDEIFETCDMHTIYRKEDKYGLRDIFGTFVEPKFDEIEEISNDDTVIFKANIGDKWGYIDTDGNLTDNEEDALTLYF